MQDLRFFQYTIRALQIGLAFLSFLSLPLLLSGAESFYFVNEVKGACLLKVFDNPLLKSLTESAEISSQGLIVTSTQSHLELVDEQTKSAVTTRLRVAPQSALELKGTDQFLLHKGALFVYLETKKSLEINGIMLPAGTFILERTANKGLKIINLENKVTLKILSNNTTKSLNQGQLTFLLEDNVWGTTLDFFMLEFLQTSFFFRGFKEKIPNETRIVNEALIQREFLKKTTNTYVGDAVSEKEFQIYKKNITTPDPSPF